MYLCCAEPTAFPYNGAEVKTDGNPLLTLILRGANNEKWSEHCQLPLRGLAKALTSIAHLIWKSIYPCYTNHDN